MNRVGILVGREKTFPDALISAINERGKGETIAEFMKLGGVRHDAPPQYDLVVDRISHEVPFYRATLKRLALEGTVIINNPFWWSADDKFFNFSLAHKIGVAVPKTVLLPQKDYIPGIVTESLRNLEFPLDWQGIVDYVGLPAILKPFDGGGWKNVSRVDSLEELWSEYDATGTLCMTLQEFINFDQFVRCYCVGQQEVMIMAYDPRKAYLSGEQYIHDPNYLAPKLAERVARDVRTLCTALGYDLNTVEFAIKDNVPYAIDFMNPAPDAELDSVGEFYHNWIVSAMTDFIFKKLAESRTPPRYRWDALLNPETTRTSAVASGTEQQGRTLVPKVLGSTKPNEAAVSTNKQKANAASVTFETKAAGDGGSKLQTNEAAPRSALRAKSETTGKTPARKSEKNPATPRSKTTL
ncbi:MAG: ATP-grasp domain-containing protein [Pyrinomonadaceae bacterium]